MQKDMRYYINLIESAQAEAELLDEGPVGKALATAALALGLQFGQQVNAEEVFVYQDQAGKLQTVSSFMQIPKDAQMSYAIDTDTKQISYIKKPGEPGAGNLTPIPKDEPIQHGAPLYGQFKKGMSLEEVQQLAPNGRVAKKQYGEVKNLLSDPALYRVLGGDHSVGDPKVDKRLPVYFHFNSNNQLTAITFHFGIPELMPIFAPVKKMKRWAGFSVGEMPQVISTLIKLLPQGIKPNAVGEIQLITGGEFTGGLSLSKLAKVGGDLGSIGISMFGKIGDMKYKVKTDKGQIMFDGSYTKDSLGHFFDFTGLSEQNGMFVSITQ